MLPPQPLSWEQMSKSILSGLKLLPFSMRTSQGLLLSELLAAYEARGLFLHSWRSFQRLHVCGVNLVEAQTHTVFGTLLQTWAGAYVSLCALSPCVHMCARYL